MPGTCRTLAQLYSLFVDNSLKLITAQDGRDLAASAMGFTASRAPGVNDDNANTAGTGQFFDVGSQWVDFVAGDMWFCVDGSVGAARWVKACCNYFPAGIQIPLTNPADIGILLQGAPLQSADLEQLKDSALNVLRRVSPRGKHVITPNDDVGLTLQLINNTTTFDQLQGLDSLGAQLWRFSYLGEVAAKGLIYGYTRITGNYTATRSDWVILADSTAGDLTVTLPAANTFPQGREIRVKKVSADAHIVHINRSGSDTLDGATTRSISTQNQGDGFTADGANSIWRGSWSFIPIGTTFGTVTSVGLSLPASILTVSGSPVTTSGTLTATLATQAAKTVFAGPASGAAAAPTFRALLPGDLPSVPTAILTFAVDYTQFTGLGAVSTATINLLAPMVPNYTCLAVGYAMNTGGAFTGGSISSSAASIAVGGAIASTAWEWTTRILPDKFIDTLIFCGNFFGATTDAVTLTLNVSSDTLNHLTNGHVTVFVVYGSF